MPTQAEVSNVVSFPSATRVRVCMAPRAQPFDECMDSLNTAIRVAQASGIQVMFEKVRGGCPGFQNAGPFMAHLLASGETHLFIAADDVLCPPDALIRLTAADKDVVSGIYRKNDLKGICPANYTESGEEFTERVRTGGLYETKFASGHTMTIKRHVIEKMTADYPELAYRQGEETHYGLFLPMIQDGTVYQDDWAFSIRARKSGFTLWDDYGCKLKHFCADFLGFEALEAQHAG